MCFCCWCCCSRRTAVISSIITVIFILVASLLLSFSNSPIPLISTDLSLTLKCNTTTSVADAALNGFYHCHMLWFHHFGSFQNDKRQGFGETITRHIKYSGDWSNDMRNGSGEMVIYENAFEYMSFLRGIWRNDSLTDENALLIQLQSPFSLLEYYKSLFRFSSNRQHHATDMAWYWVQYQGAVSSYLPSGVGSMEYKRTRDASKNLNGTTIFDTAFLSNSETLFTLNHGYFHKGILTVRNGMSSSHPHIQFHYLNNITLRIDEYSDEWSASSMGHFGKAVFELEGDKHNLADMCRSLFHIDPNLNSAVHIQAPLNSFNMSQIEQFYTWSNQMVLPTQRLSWDGRRVSSMTDKSILLGNNSTQEPIVGDEHSGMSSPQQVATHCLRMLEVELERALRIVQRMELYWLATQLRISRENVPIYQVLKAQKERQTQDKNTKQRRSSSKLEEL